MNQTNYAKMIDHTLLKPEAVVGDIEKLCKEASEHHFWSVCINPYWISTAKKFLSGTDVKICTVVGFPLGANLPQSKVHETEDALEAGADEIDMVMNIGAALEGHWNFIEHEVHEIHSVCHGKLLKVIFETCLLNDDQIKHACKASESAGADFVKTSTGFSKSGATLESVKLMRSCVPDRMGVKASGGIRDLEGAKAMIGAGAGRLGTSNGVAIVTGSGNGTGY